MSSRRKEKNPKTWKNKRCEEENPCQSEEDALPRYRRLCLGHDSRQGEVCGRCEKFSKRGGMRLLGTPDLSNVGEEASGSATQGLWLKTEKRDFK